MTRTTLHVTGPLLAIAGGTGDDGAAPVEPQRSRTICAVIEPHNADGSGLRTRRESHAMDHDRLSMPVGEVMFTQRSIRRFKPDPIPMEDLRLIIEAAMRAPNGGNSQIARFLVVTDRARIREFGALYHEAWWAKRLEQFGWTKT